MTAALLLALILLGGCESVKPRDPCVPLGIANGPPDEIEAMYLTYVAGCEVVRAATAPLMHRGLGAGTETLHGEASYGRYQSADTIFSVTMPGPLAGFGHAGYHIAEQYLPHDDYVYFTIRDPAMPSYAIKVTPVLDREYAALGMEEYADLSMRDARMQLERYSGAALRLIKSQPLQLDGKRTLFRVYSQSRPANGPALPPAIYYLVYFIKQDDRAAILTVMWPKACPQCEHGGEHDIRSMDPGLNAFVSSFAMGING
ncbi:MAG TPA: hypothetical protein VFL15_03270 [Gammaproteobacteria bacterium]|nr:hypothetical protein [Gammaproteobacteria bacterium]